MDVMRDALPVLSEKITHIFIIGMAGVGIAEMAVSNQAAVFSGLIFLYYGHRKLKNPAVNPAVGITSKKKRPPKWPKLLVEMRGLEPLTSGMRNYKFYLHPRKLDFLKSHCYKIYVMLLM